MLASGPVLALWIALATAAHVVIRSHAPFTLEQVFVSAGANAFYTVAKEHEPSDVLRRFNRVREHGPLHVQSNMPGKVLLVEALQAVTTRTGVLPWLLVAISNLGAVLMYLFVRDLFEDRRAALFSAALYLFVPARIFFFPLMNTVTPLLILGGACLLLRWLRTGHTRYAVLLESFCMALHSSNRCRSSWACSSPCCRFARLRSAASPGPGSPRRPC